MKKLFAMLLALCMLVPAMAMAEDELALYVLNDNGERGSKITLAGGTSATLEDGESYVLTGNYTGDDIVSLTANGSVRLTLEGVTVVSGADHGMEFSGGGEHAAMELILAGGSSISGNYYGLYSGVPLTVKDGESGSLTATAKMTNGGGTGSGMFCEADLTVKSGTVTGAASGEWGNGVIGSNVLIEGGTVTGVSSGEGGNGILAGVTLTVRGGTVAGTASEEGGYGIFSNSEMTVSGGEVTGTGGGVRGHGIYADDTLTITGGTVKGEAGDDEGHGIYSKKEMTVSGGKVTAEASGEEGCGVLTMDMLAIDGGELLAKGQKCAVDAENDVVLNPALVWSVMSRKGEGESWTKDSVDNAAHVAQMMIVATGGSAPAGGSVPMGGVPGTAQDLPETGDPSSLMGWAMLLAASGAAGMGLRRKKN